MFEIIKKFIAILVLGLLLCNTSFAGKVNLNKLKFSKDITKGYNILRQYGERSKGWYWASSFLKHMRTKPAGDHLLHIVKKSGGYWVLPAETISSHIATKILDQKDMLGQWNDILVNSKFTHKKDGFLKVWVNGKLSYEFKGRTHLEGDIIEQEIGIYRSFTHRRPGPDPTQVAYFDEIRFAKSCKKLKIKELGYSCKEIESQSLK